MSFTYIYTKRFHFIFPDDGTSLTMKEIVAHCMVFFIAGFETSSTTMAFTLYELATHPEIQHKVREEMFSVLKKYDNQICYESIQELEYMQQVVHGNYISQETLFYTTADSHNIK